MKHELEPIRVGDRFESRDKRDAGRVVEVVEELPVPSWVTARVATILAGPERRMTGETRESAAEWHRQRGTRFLVRSVVNPLNPAAVGRSYRVQENTLREKFRRVPR